MRILAAMSSGLRILFTNNTLARPAGTEMSVHDACLAMRARGHDVAVFSRHHGEVADRLGKAGVPVLTDPRECPFAPEVIHGHHEWETSLAALAWPAARVVSFCRGPDLWQEVPCRAPNVVLWAAVDETCRERLIVREGVAASLVRLVLNGVDLTRFQKRAGVPSAPARALVFSNYASDSNYVPAIREACAAEGIALDVMGSAAGKLCPAPEKELPAYDVVFAKGKAALEALACGCSLVVCDAAGLGPLVTMGNFDALRRQSFGNPCMTDAITPENVRVRLRAYHAGDRDAVGGHMRATCGIDATMNAIEALYREARAMPVGDDKAAWLDFATEFALKKTIAYKLGRKIQETWHEQRQLPDPAELTGALMDRLYTEWLRSDEKLAAEQARGTRLRQELDDLKTRVAQMKKPGPKPGVIDRLRAKWAGEK